MFNASHIYKYPPMPATGTESRVIVDIVRRQQMGIAKYGTTVEANPLAFKQWLNHAYEETLDYLKRAMEELDKSQDDLK